MNRQKMGLTNPMALLYGKRKITDAQVADIELAGYTLLENMAADRLDNEDSYEMGCALLVMMQVVAGSVQNRPLYDMTVASLDAWFAAGQLRVDMGRQKVQPSTQQRKAIAEVIRRWPQVLRQINQGELIGAALRWMEFRAKWELGGKPPGFVTRLVFK